MAIVEVRAFSDGMVAVCLAEDGAAVAEGEALIEIEAFKMFTRIEAPAAGIVHYRVALGELVGDNDLLAVIETIA